MLINRVSRQLLGAPELLPALSELRAGNEATVAVSQSARTLVLAYEKQADAVYQQLLCQLLDEKESGHAEL